VQMDQMSDKVLLKKDLFGEVWKTQYLGKSAVLRDARPARWWLAWLARALLRREAIALAALQDTDGIPQLIKHDRQTLLRSFTPGMPMQVGRPQSAAYFRDAARLLRRIHSAGVVHNDLAKEPNILVSEEGSPVFVDFQLTFFAISRLDVLDKAGVPVRNEKTIGLVRS